MMARYFPPNKEWVLVRILEDLGDFLRIKPEEHYRFCQDTILVPKHLVEILPE